VDWGFYFSFPGRRLFSGVGRMFFTPEILFDAELFVVFEGDAVTSAVFPL
jgi:hypothetical protein